MTVCYVAVARWLARWHLVDCCARLGSLVSIEIECLDEAESSMRSSIPYTFITPITDGSLTGADYRDWTRCQLADHNLHLDGDELKLGDDVVGFYAFLIAIRGRR